MKIKIAILGSTGSIGKTTFNIINKNKNNFDLYLLTANKNFNEIFKQAKTLKPKNIVVNNIDCFNKLKKNIKDKKINIFNNFDEFNKKFNKKIDYTMCSISGIEGLKPTLDSIKFSKKVGIANKESLICGWNLIEKELKKNKTTFIPIDSEHFSIWSLINNTDTNKIEKIFITASGGPFLNLSINKSSKITPLLATNHPNWSMGKKISVDSSTMMNKVFEIIEAKKIFKINFDKFEILTHPKSYVHAIVKFKNGLTKILIHDTNMEVPIHNSIFGINKSTLKSKKLNLEILNNLNFKKINKKKFPVINILDFIPINNSLFETVLVAANDELVDLFLKKKIKYQDITKILLKILSSGEFDKFKRKIPKNFNEIKKLNTYVRLKTQSISV